MTTFDWRHAKAADIAKAIDANPELASCGLLASLANALERIANLERERDELGELLKAFNEMVDASKLHGPGVLDKQ